MKTVRHRGFIIEITVRVVSEMDFYNWTAKREDGSIVSECESSEATEDGAITEAQEAIDDFLDN